MGRRPQPKAVKEAKDGRFHAPDKRTRRKKKPSIPAQERAQLLATLPDGEVPSFLVNDGDFGMELRIWKDLAGDLKRINALQRLDRFSLAMYCVHMADWIRATIDIREHGATYKAKSTITKDWLHKLNPMVKVREIAEKHILDLAARFGLDPTSRFSLIKTQAGLAQGMLPFGDNPPAAAEEGAAVPAPAQESEDVTGIMGRKGALPPTAH